jgi:hypothetical protein
MAYNDMTYTDWRAAYKTALEIEIGRTEMSDSEIEAARDWRVGKNEYNDNYGPHAAAMATIMAVCEGDSSYGPSDSPLQDDLLA